MRRFTYGRCRCTSGSISPIFSDRKCICIFRIVESHNNPRRVQIIIQRLALPQELWRKNNLGHYHLEGTVGQALPIAELLPHIAGVAHRNGGFNDHHGIRIHLKHQVNYFFYVAGIEEVLFGVVVGRSGYNHKIRISVCGFSI